MERTSRSSLPRQASFASAAVVGLQVLLPRVFSVLLWYHLGFLAVSLAMLGFAAGGRLVAASAARSGQPGGRLPRALLGAAAGLAIPAALVIVLRLPLETSELLEQPLMLASLAGMVLVIAVPFLLLGTLLCSALDAGRQQLGRVYGAGFLGGAAGALSTLGALQLGGTPVAAVCCTLWALFAVPHALGIPGLLVCGALVVAPQTLLPFTSRKHFPHLEPSQVIEVAEDATSQVVFFENTAHYGLWADDPDYSGPVPASIGAAIDAWAITFITRRSGPDDYPPYLEAHPAGLPFEGLEPGFSALVIGAGGGWDVLQALAAGAGHVTAVEINPLIVDAVQGRWAKESGHLYDDPRVEVVVAEGRHFVEHDERRYDRIVLAGVDTFAATQAGAFALSENYLYTVEAFQTFLQRLKPGGMLCLTRWWFDPPRQTLRVLLTAAEALRHAGVEDPRRRLFAAVAGNALVFVKGDADFEARELADLQRACKARGLEQVYAYANVWDRDPRPSHPILVSALDAQDVEAFCDAYPYRVEPSSDDRPFFFEHGKLRNLFTAEGNWIHDRLGGQEILVSCLAVLALLAWPLLLTGRARVARGAPLLPFLALGFGYLFVELPLMQHLPLLLGHPVYAVAVVLVALLSWSGLGALLAQRVPPRAAAGVLLLAAFLVLLVFVAGQPGLERLAGGFGLSGRIALVVLWLALPGIALGACFPVALRAVGGRDPALLPAAFLWNGFASVVAGPLAVLLSLSSGFRVTLLAGAGCYVLSALLVLGAHSREEAAT